MSEEPKRTAAYIRTRSKLDAMATRIWDKDGNLAFDGRDLYRKFKKPPKEG